MDEQYKNPFFEQYITPHHTFAFDKITNKDYEPAFLKAIEEHDKEIKSIVDVPTAVTFGNVIEPFEYSGRMLADIASVFFNLLEAEGNDEMMDIAQRIQPILTVHENNIILNEALFAKIKVVYNTRLESNLTSEQVRLVEKIYQSFENNGATLIGDKREQYKELSMKLSQLTLVFGQNVLKESNQFEMLLTQEIDLEGLPQTVIDAAKDRAINKDKQGWLFNLSAPSYIAFMKYSARRDLREKLYRAYNNKCCQGGDFDNRQNVKDIVNTRLHIAQLLGYKDYASYILKNKMAKTSTSVFKLLDDLRTAYDLSAHQDVKMLEGFAVGLESNNLQLQAWDWAYYAEKLQKIRYGVNEEEIRNYFELENVKKGIFGLATDLYGLTFHRNKDIPVYHSEVEAFDVLDKDGSFLAVLYTDFHPRDGKRQGAWMSEFKGQYKQDGEEHRPHIVIVMNFNRPTKTTPALLTFDEVNTFLHEFGHALHGMLTKCTYETLSGTNVARDFVELPSQLMENWLIEKEYLDRFAIDYRTGERIPKSLVKSLVDAANFNAGYACYRQLCFGYLDMAWHTLSKDFKGDVLEFEHTTIAKISLLPIIETASVSVAFNHIFSGGYAAGYYGYKWAEVLDADAFAFIKATGIFNNNIMKLFRKNILEKGNTEDPMKLYIDFRGQEPTVDALLKRTGVK